MSGRVQESMRFAILGNAGFGKSTLARWLARSENLPVLDLDTVAWEPERPAVPRPEAPAREDVAAFCGRHGSWVIEGCYANLIEAAFPHNPLLIFLDPGLEQCVANCRRRPWEPHKYPSKEVQDQNLAFLLSWVAEYYSRGGPMSLSGHRRCFGSYEGRKTAFSRSPRLDPPESEVLALLDCRQVPSGVRHATGE